MALKKEPRGHRIHSGDDRLFAAHLGAGSGVRCLGEKEMNWAYLLSGVLALGLLVYLVIALIRAEDL
jgi:K+-transporting ATPase KdpF subunit